MSSAGRLLGIAIVLSVPAAWLLAIDGTDVRLGPEPLSDSVLRVSDFGPLPPVLRESSGLAVSREYAGVFWSNNDSGDDPTIYAIDSTATLLGSFEVAGAAARDWEALDLGPCPADSGTSPWCLYAGDIGDNGRRRPWVEVHVIPEPDPANSDEGARALGSVRITYPEHPYDAEALAVAPNGDLVITTKGWDPQIVLFRIPAAEVSDALSSGRMLSAAPQQLPFKADWVLGRTVTGGTLSQDGAILALRTYTEVYFYTWPIDGALTEAAPTCFLGALEPQGEAVAFLPDWRLLVSSESPGRAGHLLAIECAGVGGG